MRTGPPSTTAVSKQAPDLSVGARILVVDDELSTATHLRNGLREVGFNVEFRTDGHAALARILLGGIDLIVLDIGLPGMDGRTLLRQLRQDGNQVAVLMLTAQDSVQDRVAGLNLGADDYLVKPFSFSELLARIRTVLRRGKPQAPTTLGIADLELDLLQHTAIRAGRRLDLSPTEYSLLAFLVRNQGVPLSRKLIAEQVWNMKFSSETNVVEVAIKRLRFKVDDPHVLKLIHTVRGIGYLCAERG